MTGLENPEIALALQAVNTEVEKLGLSVNPILEPLPEVPVPHCGEHVEVTDTDCDSLKTALNIFSYVCAAHGIKAHLEFKSIEVTDVVDEQTRGGSVKPSRVIPGSCFIAPCPPSPSCFVIC